MTEKIQRCEWICWRKVCENMRPFLMVLCLTTCHRNRQICRRGCCGRGRRQQCGKGRRRGSNNSKGRLNFLLRPLFPPFYALLHVNSISIAWQGFCSFTFPFASLPPASKRRRFRWHFTTSSKERRRIQVGACNSFRTFPAKVTKL